MALNKRLFIGGADACTTDTADKFGDSSGVLLYSMDYDASDASGSADGTPTDVTFGVEGQINYGARFNGSSSFINTNYTLTTDTTFSFSWWMNAEVPVGDDHYICNDGNGTGHDGTFAMYHTSDGKFKMWIGANGSGYAYGELTLAVTGSWMHFAVSVNGSTVTVYKNGSSAGTITLTPHNTAGILTLIIGRLGHFNGRYFEGDLDQFRYFNKAISATEVGELYAETACVYTATTTDNNYPVANTMYHKLDNSADDEIGTATSTEQEMQYRFGKYGQAGLFNGLSNGSEINTNYTVADTALTHSIWINQSGLGFANFNVVLGAYWDGTTPYHLGYYMWTNANTINWRVFYGGDGGSTSQRVEASGTITQNQWHHIVATWTDGTGAKLYIDGSLAQSVSSSETRNKNGINVAIGGFGHNRSGQANWKGLLDTYRYFNSELSASQVTELYNEKPEVDTSNFKAVLYEGNSGTQYISNVGFQPDFVWIKNRDTSNNHMLYDSVRGATKTLNSNNDGAEGTHSDALTSFDANGFFLGSKAHVNGNNNDLVAWCWKGGGDAVTNNDGTVASQVSANVDAGFSIVTNTSVAGNYTWGHGLNKAPELFIHKAINYTYGWETLFPKTFGVDAGSLTASDWEYIILSSSAAKVTNYHYGANDSVLAQVGGGWGQVNNFVTYCWHSVAGYSKIGTYTGATSGVTVNVGFAPSFVLIKSTTQSDYWGIFDNKRPSGTGNRSYIYPNTADDEDVYSGSLSGVTLTSTGFAVDNTNSHMVNENGETFLYMAFK